MNAAEKIKRLKGIFVRLEFLKSRANTTFKDTKELEKERDKLYNSLTEIDREIYFEKLKKLK